MWTASAVVSQEDPGGIVSFTIDFADTAENTADQIVETTNQSVVTITNQAIPTSTATMLISPTQTIAPSLTATITEVLTQTQTPIASSSPQAKFQVTETPNSLPLSKKASPITVKIINNEDEYGEVIDLFTLKLKIIDGDKPLAGTKVELYSTFRESVTDVDGMVTFTNVEAGIHKIKIYRGNKIIEKELSIIGDNSKDFNITIDLKVNSGQNWILWLVASLAALTLIFLLLKRKTKKI